MRFVHCPRSQDVVYTDISRAAPLKGRTALRAGRNRAIPRVSLALALALLATLLWPAGARVHASFCAQGECHYYSSVQSGTGYTNTGTGALTAAWNNYSVNQNAMGASAWSVFLINYGTRQAIEAGFFSGGAYNVSYTNIQMLAYWSINEGTTGWAYTNEPLARGQGLWVAAGVCGGCGGSLEQVGSYVNAVDGGTYNVNEPATNTAQGEVVGLSNYSAGDIAWMCGGSDSQTMYWGDGNGFYTWGFLNVTGVDSPFTESDNGVDYWYCGGY